jgi:hypothetical protein
VPPDKEADDLAARWPRACRDPLAAGQSCIIFKNGQIWVCFAYASYGDADAILKNRRFRSILAYDAVPLSLARYLIDLQSEGRIAFTRDAAIAALGITEAAFLKAAARLQKRHALFKPAMASTSRSRPNSSLGRRRRPGTSTR